MAGNKQLIFESVARDLTNGQLFDLILLDGGASYSVYVRPNTTGGVPANVAQITTAGAVPVVSPSGAGDVVGLGTTGHVMLWTDGPNSVAGDCAFIQTGLDIALYRAVPAAFLHLDSEGQKPADVGTTPGTTATPVFRVGATVTGGDTTIVTTGVGGTGSLVTINCGAGGQAAAAATSSTGGTGGAFTVNAGAGAVATVAGGGSNTGGVGGAVNLNTGTGGAANGATSGTNTGGAGGDFNFVALNGGDATTGSGPLVGGAGGAVTVRGGIGGNAGVSGSSAQGGNGGLVSIASRAGGAATNTSGNNTGGNGGACNIGTLGAGGAASGATAGTNTGGTGGTFNVTCGVGGAATNGGTNNGGTGGNVNVTAGAGGAGDTAGAGGSINFTGGAGGAGVTTGGNGGNIALTGGNAAGAGNRSGGSITITPGIQQGSGSRGFCILAGANAMLRFNGPVVAPPATADATILYSADAAAGDNNLYSQTEAGKNERLTGLASRVNTQFDSTNQTPANVTGLTFNVEAGKFYSFEAELFTTSDVAGGVKVAMGGTATATAIIYEILVIDAGLVTLQSRQTALAGAGGVTAVTAALVKIVGTIQVANAGTLTVQASRNAATGTTSVLVGSYFRLIPQGS